MPEDRPTISSSRLSAADVARHHFGITRRGFDPREVRAFLELAARELQAWEQREQDLRQQLLEAEERARHPVLDESTLSGALGEQSAQVLRQAYEEATRIVREAEDQAARLLHQAQQEAQEVQIQAEAGAARRIAEAELSAGSVHQQVDRDREAMLSTARGDADAVVEQAREQGRVMIEKAQQARKQVLEDLAHRRRSLHLQIEQIRAARDDLSATVLGVRDAVEQVVGDLARADDNARIAAARVARRPVADLGELLPEEEQALLEAVTVPGELPPAGPGTVGEAVGAAPTETVAVEVAPTEAVTAEAAPTETVAVEVAPTEMESVEVAPTAGAEAGVVEPEAGEPETVGEVGGVAIEEAGDTEPSVPEGPGGAPPGAVDEVPVPPGTGETERVDALFARLRAGRDEAAAGEGPAEPGQEAAASPELAEAEVAEAERAESAGEGPAVLGAVADEEPLAERDGPEGTELGESRLIEQRSTLLDPVIARMSRRLKRVLQDDQNRLLDRIRGASGGWTDDLLVDEEEQRAAFADAATKLLKEAFAAGHSFAREQEGSGAPARSPDSRRVDAQARSLADTVVTLLRRRLSTEGEDTGDPAERVGAAYREWRGERIERLVGDFCVGAFSAGVVASTGSGAGVRWVLTRTEGACADCDDNSLAGVVGPGDEFPTGHQHPPAHAGCRCLVYPTPV